MLPHPEASAAPGLAGLVAFPTPRRCVLDVMYAGAPYTVLKNAVHIHPTVSELIPTMLGELEPLPLQAGAAGVTARALSSSPSS